MKDFMEPIVRGHFTIEGYKSFGRVCEILEKIRAMIYAIIKSEASERKFWHDSNPRKVLDQE
jgi:hypothetical protein